MQGLRKRKCRPGWRDIPRPILPLCTESDLTASKASGQIVGVKHEKVVTLLAMTPLLASPSHTENPLQSLPSADSANRCRCRLDITELNNNDSAEIHSYFVTFIWLPYNGHYANKRGTLINLNSTNSKENKSTACLPKRPLGLPVLLRWPCLHETRRVHCRFTKAPTRTCTLLLESSPRHHSLLFKIRITNSELFQS
jgi:hypothetical protein